MESEQAAFDNLVREFNQEYLDLLKRATVEDFSRLVTPFDALKDFYEVILTTHDVCDLAFRVPVYPLTIRGNEQLFRSLGFADAEVDVLGRFFAYYRERTGADFAEPRSR